MVSPLPAMNPNKWFLHSLQCIQINGFYTIRNVSKYMISPLPPMYPNKWFIHSTMYPLTARYPNKWFLHHLQCIKINGFSTASNVSTQMVSPLSTMYIIYPNKWFIHSLECIQINGFSTHCNVCK